MSKLIKLIGEGRAIFASALCLLTCGLLAPSAVAAEICTNCLTFSASEPFGIMIHRREGAGTGKLQNPTLEYSTDQINWKGYDLFGSGEDAVFNGEAYRIYFRGTNNTSFAYQDNTYNCFTNTPGSVATEIAVSGNVETLLDYKVVQGGGHPKMTKCSLCSLFRGWLALTTTIPELPTTENLADYCYANMFCWCRNLKVVPQLPALSVPTNGYKMMFLGCESLTIMPELPATNVSMYGYSSMFFKCKVLEVNTSGTGKKWWLPSNITTGKVWNSRMFDATPGNITNTVVTPGVTYYVASAPVALSVAALPEHVETCDVMTNGAPATVPCMVQYNTAVTVTYTAAAGCVFPGGETCWSTNFWPNADQVTVAVPADQWPQPLPSEPIASAPAEVANASAAVFTNGVLSADGIVLSNGVATVVYTANDGWFFAGGATSVTNELDTTVNPAVNKESAPTAYNWERTVVTAETSPYVLEEGKTYTAVPAGNQSGGAFQVKNGATLTGTNVTFLANEANWPGGAIDNLGTVSLKGAYFTGNKAAVSGAIKNTGTLNLDGVTFSGNKSTEGVGGAFINDGTVNLDGPVTFATETDTFYNSGTLNWNLADGKAGCLNGYDKLTNADNGKLRLTVDDTLVAPTNVVLATGDFSNIAGKDTFTITNKTSGATTTIKVGGIMWLGGSWWGLAVKGGELVLETPVPTVMLSDVPVVDPETGKTNATAVVKVGDTVIPENPDGTYSVPKGYPATVVYTAKDYEKDDGFMFGPGWENKTVTLGTLSGDTKMDASLKPKAEPRWVDAAVGREIAVDTRARKVIGSPNEVLPIAYSTNQWDEVKGSSQVIIVETDPQQEMSLVAGGGHNGYADWQPTYAQYGKYMLQHGCLDKGANLIAVLTNYVYYSTPANLTLAAVEEGGAFVAITNGVEATGTISVLGFEYVTLVAWADEKWALKEVSVTTNGAPVALDKDPSSVTNRFEMPCMETVAVATFKIDEAYRGTLLENAEKSYETTTNALEGLRNNRLTDAEADEALAKARQALDKAIYDIGTATKPAEADAAAKTLDDALAELVDVEGKAHFETNRIEAVEGEDVEITVYGGSKKGPSQVTVTLQKNTLTSYTVCYGTDAKGRAKRARFPLVLNWDAGDREPKTILLSTKARAKVEADKFLTLQLGSDAALASVRPEICTVVVHDAVEPTEDEKPYVRALAWPANGGKVSGYGALRLGRDGDVASSRTLKARANRWATFAGWYAAKADDPNTIDLDRPLTDETSLRVGKNTDYGAGTYFAYFTDVTAVASVNLPDVSSATGVELDEGSYVGMVGIRFALPVSFEDETGAGRLTVTGLPGGLKYDAKAGAVTGVPTRACEKTVKFIAKNAAGKHTATFAFVIEALPAQAVGTWNGVLRASDDETHAGCGTVQFTAGKSGSLSAKAMTRGAGSRSFSAKGYSLIDANALGIAMTNRQGETFTATLSLTNDWTEAQLAGEVAGGKFAEKDEEGRFTALRNAFDRKTGEPEALALLKTFKGTYADTLYLDGHAVGTVSFKVQDGGKVFVKAKGPNGSFSGTGSGAFRITPDREGAVQTAVRNCCRLWATDALLDVLTGGISGIASDYGTDGEETCETIGESERPE